MNKLIEHRLQQPLNFYVCLKEEILIWIGHHLYLDTHQQGQTGTAVGILAICQDYPPTIVRIELTGHQSLQNLSRFCVSCILYGLY